MKKEEKEFFEELPIVIVMDPAEDSFVVFMRPLKIKEIAILNRVTHLQEKDKDSEQAAMMLVSLAVRTLDVTSSEIPAEAAGGLVAKMIEYNFPKSKINKEDKKKSSKDGSLVDCFDFLITHNHNYKDILEYSLPLFNDFITTIAERTGAKKKPVSPEDAFRKLGIPIKNRGDKKPHAKA